MVFNIAPRLINVISEAFFSLSRYVLLISYCLLTRRQSLLGFINKFYREIDKYEKKIYVPVIFFFSIKEGRIKKKSFNVM